MELLSHLTACDEKHNEPNKDQLEFAIKNGAVKKITECIARNNYDPKMIQNSSKLLQNISEKP